MLLLRRGANPQMLNNKKRSPAHVAAYNNMAEVLRELIKLGADINVKVIKMSHNLSAVSVKGKIVAFLFDFHLT